MKKFNRLSITLYPEDEKARKAVQKFWKTTLGKGYSIAEVIRQLLRHEAHSIEREGASSIL